MTDIQNKNRLSAGDMWKVMKDYLTDNIRFGKFTLNIPDDSSVTTIRQPVLVDGEYVGGIYQEARTGALFPVEDYVARIPNQNTVESMATFNFQIVMRLNGANSYETVCDAYMTALDLANDALLVIAENYSSIHKSIKYAETVSTTPVGITRAKQAQGDINPPDWLLVISPKVMLKWLPDFSDNVNTDDYFIPPHTVEVGIFIAKNNDLTDRVLDTTIVHQITD